MIGDDAFDAFRSGDRDQSLVHKRLVIRNKRGLHARAAAQFVTYAERFVASIDVIKDEQSVSARSIMGLMMLGAGLGTAIELRAEGSDAQAAIDALSDLVESGFHELE